MNRIQDNSRFIDIIYADGTTRSLCKEFINYYENELDSKSIFLSIIDDEGVSLSYWEFAVISSPTKPYPSLEAFYTDIEAILNNQAPSYTFYPKLTTHTLADTGTTTFDYTFQGDKEGELYYVLLSAGSPVPSIQEIIDGTGQGGAAVVLSGNESVLATASTVELAGLTPNTTYQLYAVTTNTEGDEIAPSIINLSQTTQA